MSNSQAPRTLSELANAYYTEKKTTIERGEPLETLVLELLSVPYFEAATSSRHQDGIAINRHFDFKIGLNTHPGEANVALTGLADTVKALAREEGLKLAKPSLTYTGEDTARLTLNLNVGGSYAQFASFTKGLGNILRIATQHKRDEAYETALVDYFL